MMNGFMVTRVAVRALYRNKTRSLLTTLGIIIGIAAVIAVWAVGQGASVMMKSQISSLGNNLVTVFPGSMRAGGFHGGMGSQQTLTAEDGEAILKECPFAVVQTPMLRTGAQLVYRENNWSTSIQGVGVDYQQVRNWTVDDGDFFTESDVKSATRVCLIGKTVVDQLFAGDNPVGQSIRVRNMPFRVLGVMSKKGTNAFGQDQDDTVLVPYTTVRRVLQRSTFNSVNQLLISLTSMEVMPAARDEIAAILRQRHRIAPGADDDFTVMDQAEVTQMITQTSRLMTVLLTVIASISLVVGGIGVMNIMLVAVTERTREIGLRMAVGARRRDILTQFLAEALALAGVGGLLGIGLGVGVARILGGVLKWPILVSPMAIVVSVACSAVVGVIFGLYPAWRASRLNPIESLRHE